MRPKTARVRPASILALSALVAVGLALYWSTLGYPPLWDDLAYVVGRPFLQYCGNLGLVVNPRYLCWVLPVENAARPVWLASVLADSCLYSGAYRGYRLTSLLWHCAGGVLLTALAEALTSDRRLALLAGLLFLVHPIHTEAVNFVAFRGELMAFAFCSMSLLLHLARRRLVGRRALAAAALSPACYALGLLSKETAAALPLLVVLVDWLFPEPGLSAARRLRRTASALLPLSAVFGGFLVFHTPRFGYDVGGRQDVLTELRDRKSWFGTQKAIEFRYLRPEERLGLEPRPWQLGEGQVVLSQPVSLPAERPPAAPWQRVYESPRVRFLTMSRVLGSYLKLLAWPYPLQGDYAPVPVSSWLHPAVAAAWLAWLILFAAAWALRRRRPLASLGLLWVAAALLPVSGLVFLANLQAERYLYSPSAGFCLLVCGALPSPRRLAVGLALAVVYAGLTVARNRDYRDGLAFYSATVDRDPDVARAGLNLAAEYDEAGRWAEAEGEYREIARRWPSFATGLLALGRFLDERGRHDESVLELKAALERAPTDARLHHALGLAFLHSGRLPEASRSLSRALALDPTLIEVQFGLADVALARGDRRGAAERLRSARSLAEAVQRADAWARASAGLRALQQAMAQPRR